MTHDSAIALLKIIAGVAVTFSVLLIIIITRPPPYMFCDKFIEDEKLPGECARYRTGNEFHRSSERD